MSDPSPCRAQSLSRAELLAEIERLRRRVDDLNQHQAETTRTIFENAPLGMFRATPAGRPLAVNRAMAAMFGYDGPEDFLARVQDMARGLHADPEAGQDLFPAMAAGAGPVCLENLFRTREGTLFLGRINADVVRDAGGKPLYVEGLVEDITESRRMEQQLRQSRAQLQDIIDNAVSLIFLKDLQGRFIMANEAFARLCGRPRDEILGKTSADLFDSGSAATAMAGDQRVIAGKKAIERETTISHQDSKRTYISTKFPLLDTVGEVYAVGAVLVDITERKRAEEEGRRAAALREEVERMTRHDLKSPLIAIVGFSRLLAQGGNLTPRQAEMVDMIRDAGRRMQRMIDLSLAMHRMEAGEYVLTPAPVDLAAVARMVAAELEDLARARDSAVVLTFHGRPAGADEEFPAAGEEFLLDPMLANVVKNALEATPEGETVTVDLARDAAGAVTVTVHNAGAVPEAVRNHFFEKYATHGKRHGTGLGTHIARLIARAHGGDAAMRTSEAEGTTITITLP